MNTEILPELRYFLASLLCGACLFAVYDILLILRGILKHFQIVVWIEDLVYWVAAAVYIFAMMYQMNNGIIRVYAIIGVVLGMILYQKLFGGWLAVLITKVLRFILSPVFFIGRRIHIFYLFLRRKIFKSAESIEKVVQKKLHKRQEKIKIKKKIKCKKKRKKEYKKEPPKEELPKKGCLEQIRPPLEKEEGSIKQNKHSKCKTKKHPKCKAK